MGKAMTTIDGVVGNVKDLKFTPSGKAVVDVSVAVTPRREQNGEWVDMTTMWFTATFWGKKAERLVEGGVKKGDLIVVSGEVTLHEYVKKDGGTGQEFKINADGWGVQPRTAARHAAEAPAGGDPWATSTLDEPPF